MSPDELNQKYTEASWLIARRSASAAGKALLFSSESMEDTVREIAAIYGLDDEEIARLRPGRGDRGAIAEAQRLATGLFGQATDPGAGQAMKLARTAVQNGQAMTMLATLVKAGPKAAQAAAAGGTAASRGTPWGWIATAGYAAGSAGWFAYNARVFNRSAFEFVREREGIAAIVSPADMPAGSAPEHRASERMTLEISLPTPAALGSRATKLAGGAGAAIGSAWGKLRRRRP